MYIVFVTRLKQFEIECTGNNGDFVIWLTWASWFGLTVKREGRASDVG